MGNTSREVHIRTIHICTHWLKPRNTPPPIPPAFGFVYEGAIGQQRQTTSLCTPLLEGVGACSSVHSVHCVRCTKPDLNGLAEHGDDEAAVDEVFSSVHISQSDVVVVFPPAHVTHLPRQFYAMLKGQCHEIFDFWFFSRISFPQAPEYTIMVVSNFFENSRRYSQLKVCHRCQRHRWQMQKIFNYKNLNYLVWTPVGSIVNI